MNKVNTTLVLSILLNIGKQIDLHKTVLVLNEFQKQRSSYIYTL
jgi:hypothetical protein